MRLLKVWGSNILSFKDFTLHLDHLGLTSVEGENKDDPTLKSNDSGKTNLVLAIFWTLYGELLKKSKAEGIINDRVGKDCMGGVRIQDGSHMYRIRRYYKDSKMGNKLLFIKDGTDLSKMDNKDTQKLVTNLMGRSFEVAKHSILYGQTLDTPFMGLSDLPRKKVLDEIMDMGSISKAKDIAARKVVETRRYQDGLQAELDRTEVELKYLKEQIAEKARSKQEQYQREKDRLEGELADVERSMQGASYNVEEYQRLKRAKGSLSKEMDGLGIDDLQTRFAKTENDLGHLEKQSEKTKYKMEKVRTLKVGIRCDCCGSIISPRGLRQHLKAVELELQQIKDEEETDVELQRRLRKNIDRQCDKKESIAKKLDVVVEFLTRMEKSKGSVEVLKSRRNSIKVALANLEQPSTKRENKDSQKLVSLRAEVENLKQRMKDSAYQLKQYEYWVEGFGQRGIRSLVLDSVCPLLTKASNLAAKDLTDGSLRIKWLPTDTTREKDDLTIETDYEYGSSLYGLSGGAQSRRIDLCVRDGLQALAQSRSHKHLNLQVYDEPFVNMDDSLVERVMLMLSRKAREVENVLVISHDPAVKESALIQTTVKVIKQNGVSRVVQ